MSDNRGNSAKRLADVSAGPWKTWPEKARHLRAIRFIETYCRAPKGKGFGQPMELAAFQKKWIRAVLADDIDLGILQTPRGNGKSSLGGALAVWAVFDDDATGAPQVPIIATTVGQAIRSCYGVAVSMIRAEPALANRSIIYTGIGTSRVWVPFNDGEMFPMSNDTAGLQGLDPSFSLIDEIGFQAIESFDSLRLASGKRERSLLVGLGTPGLDRENALFHLRKLVQEGGPQRGMVFHEYSAPEGCELSDRKAWQKANPAMKAGFLRLSALETDIGITPEGHFRVFRLGQWVDGTDSWLGSSGRAVWEALTSPWDLIEGAPTWVGVDVGRTRDSTAVVAVQLRPDGRYHATCRLWLPKAEQAVDITDVMAYLRELADRYAVQAISFDPRFFDVPAKMLEDEGLPMAEVPQSLERMTPAIGNLYELIKTGQITHDGDEPFAQQILNAVPRLNERGFTLSKGKARGRIDATIALALAIDRANHTTTAVPLATWA